jgi:putative Mg2+ transporter-C (MgtC) family protein
MSLALPWSDVFLRLGLAALAGTSVGINRGQRGRAAGLRTMLMVCTGAALAMVAASDFAGRHPGSDLSAITSRFAQGILAGMGFLGAGVILRQGTETIRGVTTAAALWYVTVLGLCLGLGLWEVGLLAWGIGLFALLLLPYAERYLHTDRYASVTVVTRAPAMTPDEFCRQIESLGLAIENLSIRDQVRRKVTTIRCDVRFHVGRQLDLPRQVVARLSALPGVREVQWK